MTPLTIIYIFHIKNEENEQEGTLCSTFTKRALCYSRVFFAVLMAFLDRMPQHRNLFYLFVVLPLIMCRSYDAIWFFNCQLRRNSHLELYESLKIKENSKRIIVHRCGSKTSFSHSLWPITKIISILTLFFIHYNFCHTFTYLFNSWQWVLPRRKSLAVTAFDAYSLSFHINEIKWQNGHQPIKNHIQRPVNGKQQQQQQLMHQELFSLCQDVLIYSTASATTKCYSWNQSISMWYYDRASIANFRHSPIFLQLHVARTIFA